MGRYFSFPLLFIAVIIQTTVVPEFRIAGGGPDFVLMLVLSWGLLAGPQEGALWAIIGGVINDLAIRTPVGTTALALVVSAGMVSLTVGQISRANFIFPPFVAAGGTVIYHGMLIILLSIIGRGPNIPYTLLNVTLPTLIANFVLMLLVYRFLGRLYTRTRPRGISL